MSCSAATPTGRTEIEVYSPTGVAFYDARAVDHRARPNRSAAISSPWPAAPRIRPTWPTRCISNASSPTSRGNSAPERRDATMAWCRARLRRRPPRAHGGGVGVHDEPEVDGLSHALQCAANLSASYPDDPDLVVAGLVHDIADIAFPHDHGDHARAARRSSSPPRAARRPARRRARRRQALPRRHRSRVPAAPQSAQHRDAATAGRHARAVGDHGARVRSRPRRDTRAPPRGRGREGSRRPAARARCVATVARAGRTMSDEVRRRRRRRRPQRPRRGRAARAAGRTCHGVGTAGTGRRRGDDRAAVGPRVQCHRVVVRRQPHAADDRAELELAKHGYKVYPQNGYFAPYRDGRALQLPDHDPARRREQIAQFSKADADAFDRWDSWLGSLADVLGPLLTTIPPRVGSRRPSDLVDQAQLAWKLRKLGVEGTADVHASVHDEHRRPARRVLQLTADARRAGGERRDRDVGRSTFGGDRVRHGAPQDR